MIQNYIDTHAHIYSLEFHDDFDAVIARAHDAGVYRMMIVTTDEEEALQAIEFAKKDPVHYQVAYGIHPEYVKDAKKVGLVICNPPFFKVDEDSNLNENEYLTIARHEIKINLEGIIKSAARILDNKGKFAMVHRPDRMIDILNLMQKYDIEPKRIRFVYPKIDRDSHVLLVEGMYKGKKGLKIEPPLYAHNADGSYSNEVRKMFGENIDE